MNNLTVKVFPYRQGLSNGNIIWAERDRGSSYYRVSKFAARGGKFPPDHPVGGGSLHDSQMGDSPSMTAFRARGYWASCFPEGDGITWMPTADQTFEQACADIRECFGWEVKAQP